MTMAKPTTKSNLRTLPALDNFTPKQALQQVLNEILAGDEYEDLMIIGIRKNSNDGLTIRASQMTSGNANWLLDRAKYFNLGLDD